MKMNNIHTRVLGKFKSIRSAIFTALSILVLCAVIVVTAVSLQYTRSSIFENSVMYTQTIINQMNQNIDSYINYMENIASLVSGGEDVQEVLFREDSGSESRNRLKDQFHTILEGREDIKNLGILKVDGNALINDGTEEINPNLDISGQEWYKKAIEADGKSVLTSSHVQHVVEGERPWVITLTESIKNADDPEDSPGVFFIDLNYSAISELCDQNSVSDTGYVFIVDQDGNIVYHPQQQQLYNELQTENISLVMESTEDTFQVKNGSEERDVYPFPFREDRLDSSGLHQCRRTPADQQPGPEHLPCDGHRPDHRCPFDLQPYRPQYHTADPAPAGFHGKGPEGRF